MECEPREGPFQEFHIFIELSLDLRINWEWLVIFEPYSSFLISEAT